LGCVHASAMGGRAVFVFQDSDGHLKSPKARPSIISLPHPRTGASCKYVITHGKLWEIQLVKPYKPSSWLIDQSVKSDGSMYLCTPFDPTFTILSQLKNQPQPNLEHFLDVPSFPDFLLFAKLIDVVSIVEKMANVDAATGTIAIDTDKVKIWLKNKVVSVKSHLEESYKNGSRAKYQGSVSTFNLGSDTLGKTDSSADLIRYTREALEIISEYLGPSLSSLVRQSFQEELEEASLLEEQERMNTASIPQTSEQILAAYNRRTPPINEELKKQEKAKSMTIAQKKLANTSTRGMKTMSSFFGAKKAK